MSDTSPILSLPYIQPSQAQKHVTHNEALRQLDVLTQTVVIDRDRPAPPTGPQIGDSHIVAPGGTGVWAGRDGNIATWDGTLWLFTAPRAGWQAQVLAETAPVVHDGTGWTLQRPDLDNLPGLGVGAASDTLNRFVVASDASLLSHAGAGHQLKLNKATAPDTASVLFQTGWSGRAEMGTTGSDGFSVKVSSDGIGWHIGLQIDSDTGEIAFPSGAALDGALTGSAVQQTPQDITPGRLMRADYGYGPGNLLAPVGLTGGQPTGGVIDRGATPDGSFVRFADGTQICVHNLDLGFLNPGRLTQTWTYPAPFHTAQDLFLSGMINVSSFNQNVTGPQIEEVLDLRFGTISKTATLAQMFRMPAGADFNPGDSVQCRLFAFGRWT